jgi:hypothetical protein
MLLRTIYFQIVSYRSVNYMAENNDIIMLRVRLLYIGQLSFIHISPELSTLLESDRGHIGVPSGMTGANVASAEPEFLLPAVNPTLARAEVFNFCIPESMCL